MIDTSVPYQLQRSDQTRIALGLPVKPIDSGMYEYDMFDVSFCHHGMEQSTSNVSHVPEYLVDRFYVPKQYQLISM